MKKKSKTDCCKNGTKRNMTNLQEIKIDGGRCGRWRSASVFRNLQDRHCLPLHGAVSQQRVVFEHLNHLTRKVLMVGTRWHQLTPGGTR